MDELRLVAGAILAGLGAVGGAIGVGVVASKYLEGVARQPELKEYAIRRVFYNDGTSRRFANYIAGFWTYISIHLDNKKRSNEF